MFWIILIVNLIVGALAVAADDAVLRQKFGDYYVGKGQQEVVRLLTLGTNKNQIAVFTVPIAFSLWFLYIPWFHMKMKKVIAVSVVMAEEGAG